MALELIRRAPQLDSFTPLSEHQAQTPASFYDGKAVLYYHGTRAELQIDSAQLEANAAFSALRSSGNAASGATNGHVEGDHRKTSIPDVDVYVTSEYVLLSLNCSLSSPTCHHHCYYHHRYHHRYHHSPPLTTTHHSSPLTTNFHSTTTSPPPHTDPACLDHRHFILFSPAASAGVRVPYPSISLHAQSGSALYMQLGLSDQSQTADDDLETLELLLTPSAPEPATTTDTTERTVADRTSSSTQALYAAVSACAEFHPDPDDDEQGADLHAPEAIPGAGGWITSENMDDFVDEDGNFRMPGGEGDSGLLGAGAGAVRTADDARFDDVDDEDEGKWRRTG